MKIPSKILVLIDFDQYDAEIMPSVLWIAKLLKGSLFVHLALQRKRTVLIPETPLALAAATGRSDNISCHKKGLQIIEKMKTTCKKNGIPCSGTISTAKFPRFSGFDLIISTQRDENTIFSRFLGSRYGRMSKANNIPVWTVKSGTSEFKSLYLFASGQEGGSPEASADFCQETFGIPNSKIVSEKSLMIRILDAELRKPDAEPPSLLVFSLSCLSGLPVFNAVYQRIEKLLLKSSHHIVFSP